MMRVINGQWISVLIGNSIGKDGIECVFRR